MINQTKKPAFVVHEQTLRILHIDFDQYTEGDLDFKQELITLLIKNLREFAQSLSHSLQENDPVIFAESCHKTKITLCMLNDDEYSDIVTTLQRVLSEKDRDESFNHCVQRFARVSEEIMASLELELTQARG